MLRQSGERASDPVLTHSARDDIMLHNTMAKLGITRPEQERIQSLLNEGHDHVLNVDIPDQIASEFGWVER